MSQLGLMRLLNNKAVMGDATLNGSQVWGIIDQLRSDPRFVTLDEPPEAEKKLRSFSEPLGYSPNLWADAYLAAFALSASLTLVTFDRGFRQFAGLDLLVLDGAA
jgi:predicted nucleic acid-binding protein